MKRRLIDSPFHPHLLPGIRNNPDSLSHKEQPAILCKHTEAARIIFQNPAEIFNLHFSPAVNVTTGSPKQDLTEPASPKAAPRPADGVIFSAFSFFASKTSSALRVCFLFYRYFMQKKAQKLPRSRWGFLPDQAAGFHFSFLKTFFCRVHTPGLLHFLSSSDMPDPDSFCRSYFCYGTSIRSLKSTRAVLHTDPIPAELPLPVVLQQHCRLRFFRCLRFNGFFRRSFYGWLRGRRFRLEQPLELVSQSLSVLVFGRRRFFVGSAVALTETDSADASLPLLCIFEFLTAKSSIINTFERMENYITDYDSL